LFIRLSSAELTRCSAKEPVRKPDRSVIPASCRHGTNRQVTPPQKRRSLWGPAWVARQWLLLGITNSDEGRQRLDGLRPLIHLELVLPGKSRIRMRGVARCVSSVDHLTDLPLCQVACRGAQEDEEHDAEDEPCVADASCDLHDPCSCNWAHVDSPVLQTVGASDAGCQLQRPSATR